MFVSWKSKGWQKWGSFPISWCFFCLGRGTFPPAPRPPGKSTWKAWVHISALLPAPSGSLGLAFMIREKKPAEGSRARLKIHISLPAWVLVSPPWWHVSSSCHLFLGAQGKKKNPPSVSCLSSYISTERRRHPAPSSREKPD